MAIIKELFEAYNSGEFPHKGGYIVSAFFDESTSYTKYEVISYSNVKDIYISDDGLVFQADGQKIFMLLEPVNYPNKHIEPAYRSDFEKIPYRHKEVELYTTKRQDRIMIGKEPVITYTNFTVMKSVSHNYSYIFFATDDILKAVEEYFLKSLWKEAGVPRTDAQKVSELLMEVFKKIIVTPA